MQPGGRSDSAGRKALQAGAGDAVGRPQWRSARAVHADVCFLGVCSVHTEVGLSIADFEEAHIKRIYDRELGTKPAGLVIADNLGTGFALCCGTGKSAHLSDYRCARR